MPFLRTNSQKAGGFGLLVFGFWLLGIADCLPPRVKPSQPMANSQYQSYGPALLDVTSLCKLPSINFRSLSLMPGVLRICLRRAAKRASASAIAWGVVLASLAGRFA
jgi:hypothetical protein